MTDQIAVPNGEQPRPVTLADIAREAGTSPSTASRALSGRGYVAADVRERLLAVADRLGYVPNASARTLKHKQSRVIGVLVSDLTNQFYASLAAGVEQTLREAGYQMVLFSDNNLLEEELDAARVFMAMRAPGVIVTPIATHATDLLRTGGIAVVEVDRQMHPASCDAVVIDNERGGEEATAHLLALGHRRIALLGVDTDWTTDAGRLAGYRAAHAAAGVPVDERLVLRISRRTPDAAERISALLDVERPTAIFAGNNRLAEQAWHVIRRRRLRLPDDISLVAFDDLPWMEMVVPQITAVAQPTLELGRRAAGLLLRRLEGDRRDPLTERLQPSLLVRGSAGPPPAISAPH